MPQGRLRLWPHGVMLVPQSSIAPVGLCVVGLAASLSRQSTPGGPRRDQQAVLDKIIRFADETRPLSWRAATVAAACVLSATVLRLLVPWLGTEVPFATYFPAILLTGLLAGAPAAFGAAIASTLIACWAFMTPRFAFTADKLSWPLLAWAFSVSLLLVFTHYGRLIMLRMRASQQEHELVAHELEHRGRNTFAVIQTVVQQALIDQPEAADAILGRIRAIKYANDLVLNQQAHAAFIDAILKYEFAPYGSDRYLLKGPEVSVSPDVARYLVLIVHELVTNAVKHGALATPEGTVHVSWQAQDGNAVLRWSETATAVSSAAPDPGRKGFGTKLIVQCLKPLSGRIETSFDERGIRHVIEFALQTVQQR
ncbi:sensor histidine kinase [Bradyrhizobium sp. SZCCHNS2002]|uniref:sensor histidine kinase n=1 Tax=Bradyrhizobium sp. SZCCHNS2002 TaxID=3057302 RepID=UPI0029168EFA|nr:sensor histidine kinase [Bradyrhizobium sp. SZCCHNS2002]